MQLISKYIYRKKHVSLYATTCSLCQFDEKNQMKIKKFSNFEIKGYKGNDYLIKYIFLIIPIRFKFYNFRCTSHAQEITMWKKNV
jgi:hypothetical protein